MFGGVHGRVFLFVVLVELNLLFHKFFFQNAIYMYIRILSRSQQFSGTFRSFQTETKPDGNAVTCGIACRGGATVILAMGDGRKAALWRNGFVCVLYLWLRPPIGTDGEHRRS